MVEEISQAICSKWSIREGAEIPNKEKWSLLHYCIQGLYHVSPKGREILLNSESFSVPSLDECEAMEYESNSSNRKRSTSESTEIPPKKKICASTRAGKDTHGLRVVKALLEDEENWREITSKDDYQYLGVFPNEQMQVIYYSQDCLSLS